ncbi:hypothetical protein AAIE21_18050 [Paenibacillus sp. 102]|uniref:hypothetical protein n=1 Tax=Paenibacillus sp. 102 TaxID=3120823 RepID=UPI0031BB04CF
MSILMMYMAMSFLLFLTVLNYIVFTTYQDNRKKRSWIGMIVMVVGTPIVMIGIAVGMMYIGIDGIGARVSTVLAGLVTFMNGTFIFLMNRAYRI